MKPKITNSCFKSYRINYEKIVRNIITKIPEKFLANLSEVVFTDEKKDSYSRIIYLIGEGETKPSIIEINMNYKDYSRYPFFSILSLNIDFILKVNEHIERYLKPNSKDTDILSNDKNRIRFSWMYFGAWTLLVYPFVLLSHPFNRIKMFRNILFKRSKR